VPLRSRRCSGTGWWSWAIPALEDHILERIAFAICETLLDLNPAASEDLLKRQDRPFPILIPVRSLANFIEQRLKHPAADQPVEWDPPDWLSIISRPVAGSRSGPEREISSETSFAGKDASFSLMDWMKPKLASEKGYGPAWCSWPGGPIRRAQIVVTQSRPPAYGGEAVIPDFSIVKVGSLEPEAVQTFISNCAAPSTRRSEARRARDHAEGVGGLHSAASRRFAEMAAPNPVMLTALAVLHWNGKRTTTDQRV